MGRAVKYRIKRWFVKQLVYFTSAQMLISKVQFVIWIAVLAKLYNASLKYYIIFGVFGFFTAWGIGYVFERLNLRKYFLQETYKYIIRENNETDIFGKK